MKGMQIFNQLMDFFSKKKESPPPEKTPLTQQVERDMRELLRENLKTIPVDVFSLDDPLTLMSPDDRKAYLMYFNDMINDGKMMGRIQYLINRQVTMMVARSDSSEFDAASAMNINGMGVIRDAIKTLATMYKKEYLVPNQPFNKQGI